MNKTKTFKPNRTLKFDEATLKVIRKRIEKKNAAFQKLTKDKQRVQIAKDVIQQLDAKKLVPTSTYFDIGNKHLDALVEGSNHSSYDTQYKDVELAEVTSQIKCQVCGIGSLFVAAVERCDKLKVTDFQEGIEGYGGRSDEVAYLSEWFSDTQLDLVEAYFEQDFDLGNNYYRNTTDECAQAERSPIYRTRSAKKRLRMIMENIVSNGGEFDPSKGRYKFDREAKRWPEENDNYEYEVSP